MRFIIGLFKSDVGYENEYLKRGEANAICVRSRIDLINISLYLKPSFKNTTHFNNDLCINSGIGSNP
jgi:hypothetical protein